MPNQKRKVTWKLTTDLIDVIALEPEAQAIVVERVMRKHYARQGIKIGYTVNPEGRGGDRPATYRIDTLNIDSDADLQAMLKLQRQYEDTDRTIKEADRIDLDKVKAAYAMFVPYIKVVRVRGRIVGAVGMFRISQSTIDTLKINPAVEPELQPEVNGELGYISGFNVLKKHCRNMRVMRLMRSATIALVEESWVRRVYAYPASDEGRRLLVDYGFTALSDNPKGLYEISIGDTYPRKKHRGN